MNAQIAMLGRLGAEPMIRKSQNGNDWTTASIAVSLGKEDDAPATWFGVVAFGRVAETLCRHGKGDLVSISGRLQLNTYRDREGNDREQLQVVADTVISARSVRANANRRQQGDRS